MEGITKNHRTAALLLAASVLMLSACDGRDAPAGKTADAIAAERPASITTASEAEQQSLAAREQELAQREAALVEQRNAVEAEADEAYTPSAQTRMTVPAGTSLEVTLATPIDTRKARVGDAIEGSLASPVLVGDARAVETGAKVYGTVTEVVSGGDKIGGVPTLGLAFDALTVEDGSRVPISARFLQQAKSDTGKDAAKILGGAAAGAVVGHQVKKDDKGTIIGGILGGAAGAAAAKNTGGEVSLPAGTVISVTTESSFQVER